MPSSSNAVADRERSRGGGNGNSNDGPAAGDYPLRSNSSAAVRLNPAMRDRDWGGQVAHSGYDIITLAGAGGQTGRGAFSAKAAATTAAAAEHLDGRPRAADHHTTRKMIPAEAAGYRGSYAPNNVTKLSNHLAEVGEPSYKHVPQHRPLTGNKNASSSGMWDLMAGR
jgi:hypothetical protein